MIATISHPLLRLDGRPPTDLLVVEDSTDLKLTTQRSDVSPEGLRRTDTESVSRAQALLPQVLDHNPTGIHDRDSVDHADRPQVVRPP